MRYTLIGCNAILLAGYLWVASASTVKILGSGRGARVTVVCIWSDFVLGQTAIVDEANNGYSIPKVFDKSTRCESERCAGAGAGALEVGLTPVEGVDWVCAWRSDDRLVSKRRVCTAIHSAAPSPAARKASQPIHRVQN